MMKGCIDVVFSSDCPNIWPVTGINFDIKKYVFDEYAVRRKYKPVYHFIESTI
jgi:hypothetical protein